MPTIWLVDTSVLLNILNVPGRNQHHEVVLEAFNERNAAKDTFLLPYVSIVETGNHIVNNKLLSGNQRRQYAQGFLNTVRHAIAGTIPFQPMQGTNPERLGLWLEGFPESATQAISVGDHLIIKEWEQYKAKMPGYTVAIWSLDQGLQGYTT